MPTLKEPTVCYFSLAAKLYASEERMFCFNWPDWIQALAALLEALAAVGLVVLTKKLYAMLPARLKHTGAMANHDRWSRTSFRAEPPDFRRFQRRARRTRISEVRVQWQTIGRLGKKR